MRRGDSSHGVAAASWDSSPEDAAGTAPADSASPLQDRTIPTRRAAQDSNPSHGAALLMGLWPVLLDRATQDRPRRITRPGERLGWTQLAAVPGKGRGRVNSAGPEPHPGVTSPWSASLCGLGYAGVHPAPIPGAVGVSRPIRPHRRLSRRRRWTRLTRSGLVDPCRHSDGRVEWLGLEPVTRRGPK